MVSQSTASLPAAPATPTIRGARVKPRFRPGVEGVLACADAVAAGYRLRRAMKAGRLFADACQDEAITQADAVVAMRLARADEQGKLRGACRGLPCSIDRARDVISGAR